MMFTTEVTIAVAHRFAVGVEVDARALEPSRWRIVGVDFDRKQGGVYLLAAVDEPARMWMTTHNASMPVEQGVEQISRQAVNFVDRYFEPVK